MVAALAPDPAEIQPLLLLGGRSTRMGQPKHLLKLPDGRRLYERQLDILCDALPNAATIYVSLAPDTVIEVELLATSYSPTPKPSEGAPQPRKLHLIYDASISSSGESTGPAAGLLAANRFSSSTTWLVLACDYALIRAEHLQHLVNAYTAPGTCFRNASGFAEPLVGIWSPAALRKLAKNCAVGMSSPSAVVRELKGRTVTLEQEDQMALWNANTPDEWRFALEHMHAKGARQ
jgi:molybdenum cofactor guanylyltransferase